VQQEDRAAVAVFLDVQGDTVRLDDPAIVSAAITWARHDPIMARRGLAVLTPPEDDEHGHDADEQHGRTYVVDHAAGTSTLAA
jgi:hypothetical protein